MSAENPNKILNEKIWKNWDICISNLNPFEDKIDDFSGIATLTGTQIRTALFQENENKNFQTVSIRGAYISGLLNLNGLQSKINLQFVNCIFEKEVYIQTAELNKLVFSGCKVFGADVRGSNLLLALTISDCEFLSEINISDSRIEHYVEIKIQNLEAIKNL